MNRKKIFLLGALIVVCGLLTTVFTVLKPVQPKPETAPQRIYDYYLIIDEQDGHTLMYIPLIAHIGDEVLSEENKLYTITRIEENRAYARYVKNVQLQAP